MKKHIFMLKMFYEVSPFQTLLILGQAILGVATVFAGLKMSESIVAMVMSGNSLPTILKSVAIIVGGVSVLLLAESFVRLKITGLIARNRIGSLTKYLDTIVDTDYQNLIDPHFQKKMEEVIMASSNDAELFGVYVPHVISFIQEGLKLLLLGSFLFVLDSRFLVLIVLLMVSTIIYRVYQSKVVTAMRSDRADYIKKMEYLINQSGDFKVAKDMRLYGVKDWFNDIFQDLLNKANTSLRKSNLVVLFGQILSGLLISLLTAYGYYVFIGSYMNYDMTLASLTFYIGALTAITGGMFSFITSVFDLYQDTKEIAPIIEYFNYPCKFNHEAAPLNLGDITSIEFKNVSYTYPGSEKAVFTDFNLMVTGTQKIAVVGLNGAGKSTLAKLLCNLIKPDSGQILINGIDNQSVNVDEYYEYFSVVFQEQFSMPITIKETIVQTSQYDEDKYQWALKQSGVSSFLTNFEKGDHISLIKAFDEESASLSGGQMQKLKLAQALYKDGSVLILDEPTAALDPISESEIYQNYFELAKDKISFFITHRLASTQFCDRIIYIDQGTIIEDGTHDELLKQAGKYATLFDKQAFYYKEELDNETI